LLLGKSKLLKGLSNVAYYVIVDVAWHKDIKKRGFLAPLGLFFMEDGPLRPHFGSKDGLHSVILGWALLREAALLTIS
jgi:hypothetical protein